MVKLITLFLLLLTFSCTSAKEKPHVTLTQSADQVWQRQQTLITLTVKTDDPFSRLEIEPFQQKGLNIIPYKQKRTEYKDHVLLTMKWVVFPFVAGTQQLTLPKIVYRPNGGRKQVLDIETPSLDVKRLPIYVPPTMPVGSIHLNSQWTNHWLVPPNNLLSWQLNVLGKGVAKPTMPPITRQIINNESLQFLPTKNKRSIVFSDNGITNQLSYSIPLKTTKNGIVDFPNIKVQYFEPISGKLHTEKLSPPFVLSLNKWLQVVIIVLVLLGSVILFTILFKVVKQIIFISAQKRRALKLLAQAKNYAQIKAALNQFSNAKEWQNNATINSFLIHWEGEYGTSPELSNALKKLQKCEFSNNNKSDFTAISQSLLKAISNK